MDVLKISVSLAWDITGRMHKFQVHTVIIIMDGNMYVRRLVTVLLPSEASSAMMKGINSLSPPKYYDTPLVMATSN